MIKVLLVSHTYVVGVNQQKIEELSKNNELKVTLLVPAFWKAPLRETPLEKTKDDNYEIISPKVWFNGSNDKFLFPFFSLFKILRKINPDVIQVEEEPWSLSLLQFSLLAKFFRSKLIFFTWENIRRKHSFLRGLVQSFNLRNADAAIAGNTEAKQVLIDSGFKKEILVLPQLGVDPTFFKRKKEGEKVFTIGFIGRLEEQKGIKILLQAVKLLDFKYKLLLIGSGPLKEKIDDFIHENNLLDSVEVIQGVTHDQVPDNLNKLSVLVLPSLTTPVWKEQFGHVLIEAMAAGVIVIGSSSGAIPEVVDDAGLIFEEGNASDLADKIKLLYKDKKIREDLSKKGERRVKEFYTQEKIANQTFKFYQQILKVN